MDELRRVAALGVLAVVLSGCFIVGGEVRPVPQAPPVPAGQIGPVFENPTGGPPIECRGVPRGECVGMGDVSGVPDAEQIVRIIVTCTAASCTPAIGELRIDLLMRDGTMRENGGVGWVSN